MRIKIKYNGKQYRTSTKAIKLIIKALAGPSIHGCVVCKQYTCRKKKNKPLCILDTLNYDNGCITVGKDLFNVKDFFDATDYPQQSKYWRNRLMQCLSSGVIDLDRRPKHDQS